MTQEEKDIKYRPKRWAMYNNDNFITTFPSHNAAKRALHKKCVEMKKYPYDYADDYYSIKPYNS